MRAERKENTQWVFLARSQNAGEAIPPERLMKSVLEKDGENYHNVLNIIPG
jgi:hypothetical protein